MLNRRLLNQIADPSEELLKALGHLRVAVSVAMHGDTALRVQANLMRRHADDLDGIYNAMKTNEVRCADPTS